MLLLVGLLGGRSREWANSQWDSSNSEAAVEQRPLSPFQPRPRQQDVLEVDAVIISQQAPELLE